MERKATQAKTIGKLLASSLNGQHRTFHQVKFGGMTCMDLEALKEEANAYVSRLPLTARQKAKLKHGMNKKLDIWIRAFGGGEEESKSFFD